MAKLIPLPDGSVWEALGGKTRRYRLVSVAGEPVEGGATISRRQFDKLSGRLGEFASYEAKAKASPPEVREARPARGRRTTGIAPDYDFRRMAPFRGRITRDVTIDFEPELLVTDKDTFEIVLKRAATMRVPYESTKNSFIRNGKVSRVQLIVGWGEYDPDEPDVGVGEEIRYLTIQAPTFPDELFTFEEFIQSLTLSGPVRSSLGVIEGGVAYYFVIFRVAFKRQYVKARVRVPKGTLKRDLAGARKRSAGRSARRR